MTPGPRRIRRILYVTHGDLRAKRGYVDHIWGVANAWHQAGLEVTLLARAPPPADDGRPWPPLHPLTQRGAGMGWLRFALAVRGVLRREAASYDAVYLRQSSLDFLHGRVGAPLFVEVNTFLATELRSRRLRARAWLLGRLARGPLRRAAGWLPVTPELGRLVAADTGAERPWRAVGNGIDRSQVDHACPDRSTAPPPREKVLLMLGWSHPWQGVDRALGALALLGAGYRLWLAGDATEAERAEVLAQAEALGVAGRVRILDWTAPRDLPRLFAQAHLGLSSLGLDRKGLQEAQPMKSRRYLAGGLPFATNHRDARIPPSGFALLAADLSPAALAEAVRRYDPRAAPKRDLLAFVEGRLTWDAVARETLEFMESVLGGGAPAAGPPPR